jgi:hypothetical protein
MHRTAIRLPAAVVLAMLLLAVLAHAHHSIANVYDFSRRTTLDGVVVLFEFVNPHPFITVDAKSAGSAPERWRLEMDNRWELAELGFEGGTLRAGDRLVLVVNPARSQPLRAYVRQLDRPADGFRYRHHD